MKGDGGGWSDGALGEGGCSDGGGPGRVKKAWPACQLRHGTRICLPLSRKGPDAAKDSRSERQRANQMEVELSLDWPKFAGPHQPSTLPGTAIPS